MELNQAPAGIGDNDPPEDTNPTHDRLTDEHATLLARRDELVAAEARVPACTSEEAAKKIGDYIKEINKCLKRAEAAREETKAPVLEETKRIDGFFKGEIGGTKKNDDGPLNKIKRRVNELLTVYQRQVEAAERKRLAEQAEADRKAAEEAAAEAQRAADKLADENALVEAVEKEEAAKAAAEAAAESDKKADQSAADLSRTRSKVGGSTSSLVSTWEFEGVDRDTIDLEALRPHLTQKAIEQAVGAAVRSGVREIKGVGRIYEVKKSRVT
jgi:multidrug efflux pump subunit AcrA (membrane-fusion protein)